MKVQSPIPFTAHFVKYLEKTLNKTSSKRIFR